MAASPERQREIADFFAGHERDVRQAVAYRVRHIPAAAIEDACQTAWEKLSRRPDVDLRATGRAWLVTVAVHEAFEHYRRGRVESPAGAFRTADTDTAAFGELSDPWAMTVTWLTTSPTSCCMHGGSVICGGLRLRIGRPCI